jgi:hypothetical protein
VRFCQVRVEVISFLFVSGSCQLHKIFIELFFTLWKIELGLSPWKSATTSDEFWDRGLEDNPQFPISAAPAIR